MIRRSPWWLHPLPWLVTLVVVSFAVWLGWIIYDDSHMQTACWEQGNQVVQAQHGHGWSCMEKPK